MPRKRGPGRPRLGADTRSVVVPVRITKAQYREISARVATESESNPNATVSSWVRAVIAGAL